MSGFLCFRSNINFFLVTLCLDAHRRFQGLGYAWMPSRLMAYCHFQLSFMVCEWSIVVWLCLDVLLDVGLRTVMWLSIASSLLRLHAWLLFLDRWRWLWSWNFLIGSYVDVRLVLLLHGTKYFSGKLKGCNGNKGVVISISIWMIRWIERVVKNEMIPHSS